jgi:Uma2 family endonuclease
MTAPSPQRLPLAPESMDQRVRLDGVPWETYEALLVLRGEGAVPRITYLEGELELMTPSLDHEGLKKRLARLLEAYAEARGIALEGFGSWTLRKTLAERGLEPDECYLLGVPASPPERPDIAIEVVWTSGGIDKLAVYRGLGVPEVWFRQDGALSQTAALHLLRQVLRNPSAPGR